MDSRAHAVAIHGDPWSWPQTSVSSQEGMRPHGLGFWLAFRAALTTLLPSTLGLRVFMHLAEQLLCLRGSWQDLQEKLTHMPRHWSPDLHRSEQAVVFREHGKLLCLHRTSLRLMSSPSGMRHKPEMAVAPFLSFSTTIALIEVSISAAIQLNRKGTNPTQWDFSSVL